jgi:hypothetical protein
MTAFEPSELTRNRARRNAALVKRTKSWNRYGAGYIRDTIMQCSKHHVDYVLRYSARKAPTLLMYDCPEEGCFNTLQVAKK